MRRELAWSKSAWGLLVAVPWVTLLPGCSCPTAYREMKLTPDGVSLLHGAADGRLSSEQCAALCEGREGASSGPRADMHWTCRLEHGDRGAVVACDGTMSCIGGRRPEGARLADETHEDSYFASMAALEAASVVAFVELAEALAAHGAPDALVVGSLRAAREEVAHARATAALARAGGQEPNPVTLERGATPSLEALATLNASEGCAAELFAALVARHQAAHASHTGLRSTFSKIASDEISHAALSREVDAWATRGLDRSARRRVVEAQDRRRLELARAAEHEVAIARRIELGWPSAERAVELARSMPTLA